MNKKDYKLNLLDFFLKNLSFHLMTSYNFSYIENIIGEEKYKIIKIKLKEAGKELENELYLKLINIIKEMDNGISHHERTID